MDKLEIQELTARYALAMDNHDLKAWMNTWAPNGRWDGSIGLYEGDRLANLLADLGERIAGKRHVITNHVIDIHDQKATQTCYMQILKVNGGAALVATAVYQDQLVKIDGHWRFLERKMTVDR